MIRPNRDQVFMAMALVIAQRGTCPRRQVGCVLINYDNYIVATGYNGAAKGQPHCINPRFRCPGADYPPGQGYDKCQAVHAEQNALIQCQDTSLIKTAYITTTPCVSCMKLFLNTNTQKIVVHEDHGSWGEAAELWRQARGKDAISVLPWRLKIKMDF